MPDSMGSDFSEIEALARDLGQVSSLAGPFLRQAIEVTSGKVKKTAQDSVKRDDRSKRFKNLPGTIDYDITVEAGAGGSSLSSEIGYNRERYGDRAKTGNLREFGAPNADGVPLAPHNDLLNALHENEKDLEFGIDKALRDAEKLAGL